MKRVLHLVGFLAFGFIVASCVPKTHYEDQQARLKEAQAKLNNELSTVECDTDMFMQLREQAQSLDLLTQELVERNTELSKEVARLKVFESQTRNEDLNCEKRMTARLNECEGRFSRTRSTYEDLIAELKNEVARLKEVVEKNASKPAQEPKPRAKSGKDKTKSEAKPESKSEAKAGKSGVKSASAPINEKK